jgi:signal peptide peptidase SppA
MLAEEKEMPVLTFTEDVAASGGYWLACAGDEIYASASSVVGSIGVISAGFGFVDALKRLGIERRVYTQGDRKSILDPFQEEKKEDVQLLLDVQKDVHEAFVELVSARREGKINLRQKKTLFSGQFWNGKRAVELGLVDQLGDMYSDCREKYGKKVNFVKLSKPKSWLKRKLGGIYYSSFQSLLGTIEERSIWERFGR